MKKVLLLSTGGTIASIKTEKGLTPGRFSRELLEYIPQVKYFAEVTAKDLLNIDSSNMQPEDWLEIAKEIVRNYNDYDGFVITHGTDTMEYTSSALTYLLKNLSKPVVLTGSQKSIEEPLGDANRNLIDAVRFACEDISGVFVAFCGKIINGPRAKKINSKSYDAFDSINYPVVASVKENYVCYHERACQDFEPSLSSYNGQVYCEDQIVPDVNLLKLVPGLDPGLIKEISKHCRGMVIESFGLGGLSDRKRNMFDALENALNRGIYIAITTQVLREGIELGTYALGDKVTNLKVISGKDMTPSALVVKMMWALAKNQNFEELKKVIHTPIQKDIY
ncbi:asparaginase [Natranaerobius thermophilus]|uniref:asparaginase n=1 Tax=Natranaerobius thermophilus (strain ATCC BAA-1301 / DSM 18059 / JW/NM-WN-LF) TaxID=457570 RepID=B2A299_NATTJ|nr:asparaginase [Natranaerobius thermophilus]ACB86205.1 L-asparaginase, type I [Natranaerobius thermophilus JW/NM-WN-LF]